MSVRMSGREVFTDSAGVVLLPRLGQAPVGVLLVQQDEQVHQLAADRFRGQQLRQFRQLNQPVGIPGRPVRVLPSTIR